MSFDKKSMIDRVAIDDLAILTLDIERMLSAARGDIVRQRADLLAEDRGMARLIAIGGIGVVTGMLEAALGRFRKLSADYSATEFGDADNAKTD